MSFIIVHISDLHFNSYPKTWKEWSSKRALGAFGLFVRRAREYPIQRAQCLVRTLQERPWDHLVITGDLTSLGLEREFALARETLAPLLTNPEKVTIIPGNHDRYVQEACNPDLFQQYFGLFFDPSGFQGKRLNENWHLIGWDSTHPNDWLTAAGTVKRTTLLQTEKYIQRHSPESRFIIANHYPVWFPEHHKIHRRHELHNLFQVQQWLMKQSQIHLYLHGHVHRNWNRCIQGSNQSLFVVNSASSTSTCLRNQVSTFHQIKLQKKHLSIEPLSYS
ncbi:metallophosphoesterase [Deltaproteobacteria bacterium TL4]